MSSANRKLKRTIRREIEKTRPIFVRALVTLPFKARCKVAWKIIIGESF